MIGKIFSVCRWGMVGALLVLGGAQAQVLDKHNSKLPIEITADSLQVSQNEKTAVFSGHVVAVQGTISLKSDKMTVHYREAKQKKSGGNAISLIEVDGHVLLATPEESAQGEKGVYHVDAKEITLNRNVVLTKGKNILKGDRLAYNLASGKSVVTGGGAAGGVNGTTAAPGGRVRGVFVPEESEP